MNLMRSVILSSVAALPLAAQTNHYFEIEVEDFVTTYSSSSHEVVENRWSDNGVADVGNNTLTVNPGLTFTPQAGDTLTLRFVPDMDMFVVEYFPDNRYLRWGMLLQATDNTTTFTPPNPANTNNLVSVDTSSVFPDITTEIYSRTNSSINVNVWASAFTSPFYVSDLDYSYASDYLELTVYFDTNSELIGEELRLRRAFVFFIGEFASGDTIPLYFGDLPMPSCMSDLNNDGVVDILDLLEFLGDGYFADPCPAPCEADFDNDGDVDIIDLLEFLADFFNGC